MLHTLLTAGLLGIPIYAGPPNGAIEIIAVRGDPVPGTGATMRNFRSPVLNNQGELAFWYNDNSGSESGILLWSMGELRVPVRSGDIVGGNDTLHSFNAMNADQMVGLTDSGLLVVEGTILTSDGSDQYDAIVRVSESGNELLAYEGQAFPIGTGTLDGVFENVRINQSAEVAFIGYAKQFTPPLNGGSHTLYVDSQGIMHAAVASSATDPQNETRGSRDLALSDTGVIATGRYEEVAGVSTTGLIKWENGQGPFVYTNSQVVPGVGTTCCFGNSEGQAVVDENGNIFFIQNVTGAIADMNSVLLRADGMTVEKVVQEGVDLPSDMDQNDLQGLGDSLAVNAHGTLAFATRDGAYRVRNGQIVQMIAKDDPVGDGSRTIEMTGNAHHGKVAMAVNRSDQVAFFALTTPSGQPVPNGEGIFLYDDNVGFRAIVLTGDDLLGSTINGLEFLSESVSGEESNGFNDSGKIAFEFRLTDTRTGIALIDPFATPCLADTNGDGLLTPADFTAWINAFNNQLPACDQNNDDICSPADFTAWIANYNAGCS